MADKLKSQRGGIGRFFLNLFIFLVFIGGAAILLYPTYSDLWNRYRNSKLISNYTQTIEALPEEDYSALWEAAITYNKEHRVNNIMDAFDEEEETEGDGTESSKHSEYYSLLNPIGDSIMGYLEIPKISVSLAIYHGTGNDALDNGVGHIEGTSLPIGGESTHSVLSAHRGLPSAKLFTDLDQVFEGDKFFITVLGEKFAYQVDQILVVLPEELDALAIEEGKDLVTLVTCTPYAVNTHRMLVRGHRIEYTEEVLEEEQLDLVDSMVYNGTYRTTALVLGVMVFIILVLLMKIIFGRKRK